MWFINQIIDWLWTLVSWLWTAYYAVQGWIPPFNSLASPLEGLARAFSNIASAFGAFNDWLVWATGRISQMIDWTAINSYFNYWAVTIGQMSYWISTLSTYISTLVSNWWNTSNNPIRLYIDQAIAAIKALPDQLVSEFNAVKTAWDNFCQYTVPQWTASLKSYWDSFTAFMGSIGQTILDHLTAFWNDTILPAINTIKQDIASLHLPSWDDIWSFILSKLPHIDDVLNWWGEFCQDVKEFFADPSIWLWKYFDFGWILASMTDIINAWNPLTPEEQERVDSLQDVPKVIDEGVELIKTEKMEGTSPQNKMIYATLAKIQARIKSEIEEGRKS